MSEVFFKEMNIPTPNINLNVNSLNHGAMTGLMMQKLEPVLLDVNPDVVLVYGDTDSTLAGALTARKLHFKVAHVEAGLRSFNMNMPEEINRILTDRIANYLFCPTDTAILNLEKEGFNNFDCEILNVGDVMYDAALYYKSQSIKPNPDLPEKFILATVHRAENTDDNNKLNSIFKALDYVSKNICKVVIPLHPRTFKKLESNNYNFKNSNIIFIDPVGYKQMVWLTSNSSLVVTDSGGLQKEAFFFEKYCITLRDETEWTELVQNKVNFIVKQDSIKIITTISDLLNSDGKIFNNIPQLYGDGTAGKKIVQNLLNN